MLLPFHAVRVSAAAFCCWFVVLLLWLPTAIGGWLVYLNLLDAGHMWLGSIAISIFSAVYLARKKE